VTSARNLEANPLLCELGFHFLYSALCDPVLRNMTFKFIHSRNWSSYVLQQSSPMRALQEKTREGCAAYLMTLGWPLEFISVDLRISAKHGEIGYLKMMFDQLFRPQQTVDSDKDKSDNSSWIVRMFRTLVCLSAVPEEFERPPELDAFELGMPVDSTS